MDRRGFLFGATATLILSPAIVRAASLMPVRGIVMDSGLPLISTDHPYYDGPERPFLDHDIETDALELVTITFSVDENGNLVKGRRLSLHR